MDETAPPSAQRRAFDPGAVVASVLTAYAAVYVAWLAIGHANAALLDKVSSLAFIPMNAMMIAVAWRAAARRGDDPALRRAMALIGASFATVLVANAVTYAEFRGTDSGDSWVNVLFLPAYPGLLAALLALPRARRTPHELRKYVFDLTTVVLGCGLAVW